MRILEIKIYFNNGLPFQMLKSIWIKWIFEVQTRAVGRYLKSHEFQQADFVPRFATARQRRKRGSEKPDLVTE